MIQTATLSAAEFRTRKPNNERSMPQITSKDGLKSFLLTSRLLSPSEWNSVDPQLNDSNSVESLLQILERRQLLTPLQTGRILKGDTEGLVLGKYKLLYRNASGSFARVFRAASVDDNRVVALKLLRERWADDPRTVANFEREARISQKFVHPNIVPIFDIGNEGRFHYFTMEFVEGGNLRDFMKIRRVLSPVEATRCMLQICLGLEYALKMGATHRDIKLTNILMNSTGVAKLVDFGLAGAASPSQAGTSDDVQRALEYASLERGTRQDLPPVFDALREMATIHVQVSQGNGPWHSAGVYREAGPIATDLSVVPIALPPGEGPIRIRLDLARGFWRLNQVALARLGNPVTPTTLDAQSVDHVATSSINPASGAAINPLSVLNDSEHHLITYPGDQYALRFELPARANNAPRELFLESTGYYYEWMRPEWLPEENAAKAAQLLYTPAAALKALAPQFKMREAGMDSVFWNSRVGRVRP